ncbi:MAG: polymerase [Treponema sp.]|jgi:hypothetical protein|nr:polymerase [Treponema sp.]
MNRITALLLVFFAAAGVFADTKIEITGLVEWDTMEIKASVSLDLASAGVRLPGGRSQGEVLLSEGYLRLIRPGILELQVDSSSTIADLINRGEFSLTEVEGLALTARSLPPALSHDMLKMSASYTVSISGVSAAFLRHSRSAPVTRTLNPVSTARYTGIIIIAPESLPVYSMRSEAIAIPCLFPKIWDSEMNLIYERNMLQPGISTMVRYSPPTAIFQNNPSGLSPELRAVVGDRPLRIFASGVFGIKPTDLIIDRSDALLIISSDENRRLLSEGKVAVILNESVLRSEFSGE